MHVAKEDKQTFPSYSNISVMISRSTQKFK